MFMKYKIILVTDKMYQMLQHEGRIPNEISVVKYFGIQQYFGNYINVHIF